MKKDVYILSGFLGSGKTTLLKGLLESLKADGTKPAVLMNELGSVSIDSDQVDEDTALREMLDGCICCTLSDKLESQLQDLLIKEDFGALVIETTGAAHPVEVVDSILSPLFADRFHFKGILTVVDGLQWKERGSFSPSVLHLMREQIRHASFLVANKVDLLTEVEQGTFAYELQQLNPGASIYLTSHSKVPVEAITSMTKKDRYEGGQGHTLTLQAIVHTFEAEVSREDFEQWVHAHQESIYRMKGYIPLQGRKHPTLFQYSYGMPLYMPGDMNYPTNFVVIGEGMDRERIISSLKSLEG